MRKVPPLKSINSLLTNQTSNLVQVVDNLILNEMESFNVLNSTNFVFPAVKLLISETKAFKGKDERHYRTKIKNLYKKQCLISLVTESSETPLEVHHLYSQFYYPQYKYNFLNGVPLTAKLHKEYHRLNGLNTSNITPNTFITYLEMKISETNSFEQKVHLTKLIAWIKKLDFNLKL